MSTKVGLNGFGRIGRLVFRQLMEAEELDVVGVNDIAPLDNLAYLLRYDSVYSGPDEDVEVADGDLTYGGQVVPVFSEKSPADLPWTDVGAQIILECTGRFTSGEDAAQHLDAGAKYVIISAPAKGDRPVKTFCMGVNEDEFDPAQHTIISNASCTTNCLVPVAKVLDDAFGIVTGFLTTVHGVTASQGIVDGPAKKMRRGRSGMVNIVPTTTGAALATTEVLPNLEGKMDGVALRVPVICGSIIDFVVQTEKKVTVGAVNQAFEQAAESERMEGRIGITDEELVSSDIIGMEYSALVDAQSTMVLGEHTAKVLAWYDNEWGYSHTLVDLTRHVAGMI